MNALDIKNGTLDVTIDERLARIEQMLEEVRAFMFETRGPVREMDGRIDRMDRDLRAIENRLTVLETWQKVRYWAVGLGAGLGSSIVTMLLSRLLG